MRFTSKSFVISTCLVVLLGIFLFVLSGSAGASRVPPEYGPTWERTCTAEECTVQMYPYEKYWETTPGQWEPIDEGFSDCSTEVRTQYCTNEYYFSVKLDDQGQASFSREGRTSHIRLASVDGQSGTFTPERSGNRLTYSNVRPGIDVRYQFLPHKLKEEVILNEPPTLSDDRSFTLSFNRADVDSDLIMEPPYICDAHMDCLYLPYTDEEGLVTVRVPHDFFLRENLTYPLTIDPTFFYNSTYTSWNGYVDYVDDPKYVRYNNPSWLIVKDVGTKGDRAAIEWQHAEIPSDSAITSIHLKFYTDSAFSQYNLTFWPLANLSTSYNATQTGDCPESNCLFYQDMGDGDDPYAELQSLDDGSNEAIFSSKALFDFQEDFADKHWGFGIVSPDYEVEIGIGARDNADPDKRPSLTVVYGVNSTNGNKWIEKGINNSLPLNPFYKDQQIYLVNQYGQQYKGTFDRVTLVNNQTWAFNYLVGTQTPIGMPSLFRVLNTWENISLNSSQIISQVENFINSTRY